MSRICLALAIGVALLVRPAAVSAWDEDGHALITLLAHDKLPKSMPDWLRAPDVRARLVYLASEPDRWRGQHNLQLDHINKPEHYLDVETLSEFGLTLQALPPLRRQFTDHLANWRATHKESQESFGTGRDQDYVSHVPGLLPYVIVETQWKIAASWTQLKTYEAHPDRASPSMIQNARENIVYHMGILSHYIGDGSQPLHLTKHHNGWEGDNPKGYTTDKTFHAFIDDGILRHHVINYDDLIDRAQPARAVSTETYWQDTLSYLDESHRLVEPLYDLDKRGELRKAEGKRFIEDRMLAAAAMLAGVWDAAYRGAHIDEFRVKRLLDRYPHKPGRKAGHGGKEVRVGMAWDEAARLLASLGAELFHYQTIPVEKTCNEGYFNLANSVQLRLIGDNADGICRVSRISYTDVEPDWNSKTDPKRDEFFKSFRPVASYDLSFSAQQKTPPRFDR